MSDELKQIAEHYGFDNQADIAIEEMSELTKALCKLRRRHERINTIEQEELAENVAEEIADVVIMMQQLIYLMGNDIEVEKVVEQKIKRQIKRIEEENKKEGRRT